MVILQYTNSLIFWWSVSNFSYKNFLIRNMFIRIYNQKSERSMLHFWKKQPAIYCILYNCWVGQALRILKAYRQNSVSTKRYLLVRKKSWTGSKQHHKTRLNLTIEASLQKPSHQNIFKRALSLDSSNDINNLFDPWSTLKEDKPRLACRRWTFESPDLIHSIPVQWMNPQTRQASIVFFVFFMVV